ncbi:JAB domain-containing protein [Pseudomonas aeruginosa]|uniref:JAB domain-containing protein n=1 Tax=Pseudomonas aeruginosa TaxID=287 RepID=UPI00291631F7|nr:JAB domain-containing protein [Pseudomonas aeruginosa]
MSQLSFSSFDAMLLVRDAQGRYLPASVDQILNMARQVIDQKYQRGALFTSPELVKDYLRTKLAGFEHEVFAALFLDSQHRLLEYVELFRGTIDAAAVYPREVVKEALRVNAAAVIFSHKGCHFRSASPAMSCSALARCPLRCMPRFVLACTRC